MYKRYVVSLLMWISKATQVVIVCRSASRLYCYLQARWMSHWRCRSGRHQCMKWQSMDQLPTGLTRTARTRLQAQMAQSTWR